MTVACTINTNWAYSSVALALSRSVNYNCKVKGKLKITGQNLGWVFSTRFYRACLGHAIVHVTKQLNIKLKTRPKQLLGSLPLAFVLPGKVCCKLKPGSVKANRREPKSCLGWVFNFKLGCFVICTTAWPLQARPSLELKTRPRLCPVSLSLSMLKRTFIIITHL
jgi:hypothetical protein